MAAIAKVMNDIIRSIDDGKVVPLVLLDLSAAFETVDHDILLEVSRIASRSKSLQNLDQRHSTAVVPLVLNRPDSVNQCKRFSFSLQCSCLQRTTRKRSRLHLPQ